MRNSVFTSASKYDGSELTTLFLAKEASSPRISCPVSCHMKSASETVMASSIKLLVAIRILRFALAANLVILSGDVSLNPGPTGPSLHSSFSSSSFFSDESSLDSFDSSNMLEDCNNNIFPHFDLGLDDKGLRIGHWNVNRLSSAKFDQIKLFLIGKSGSPQVDILFLTETFLKPDNPDVLYAVPGFSIHRHDRVSRCGGGVLVFVNDDLKLKRRDDLEDLDLEVIWLEVFPFKSNRSLFISGIYRPPWYSLADDTRLEKNIEQAYLLNNELILLGDWNINALDRLKFKKHHLSKGLLAMNLNQLVLEITRPMSGTCLDHIYSNHSHRIHNIVCPVVGLADRLPLFAVRKYSNQRERPNARKINNCIQYRNMKRFDAELFKQTLMQTPWDSVFIFDDIDDMLDSWEKLFNDALEQHCPWRIKRVARVNQAPWITPAIIKQLQFRDALLKKFKHHRNPCVWADYKKARNKAVSMLRSAKRKFYVSKLEQNVNNAKGTWKIIKSISGMVNQSKRVNSLRVEDRIIEDTAEMASEFNSHFTSVADKLRSLLPQTNFDMSKLINFVC